MQKNKIRRFDAPKELDHVAIKPWPDCYRAADGRFWSHTGDGNWQPESRIYELVGTEEAKAKFLRLCEGKND